MFAMFVVVLGLVAAPRGRAETEPSVSASVSAVAPSASSSTVAPSAVAIARLKDRKVFTLSLPRQGRSAADRARNAGQALEHAFDSHEPGEARFERTDGVAVVYVGKIPIVEVDEADAEAAGATKLEAYAGELASKINNALKEEGKRSAIANTVFSISLIVFAGLIAFLLLGKVSQIGRRAQDWLEENPDRVPPLRVGGVELMRPAAIHAFLTLSISIAKRLVQLAVLYAWIIFALSLFESTKGYTDKLTALVLGPVSGFLTRVGTGLPLAVVTILAVLATALLVRFTGVFFAGVARGETTVSFIPQDLAHHVGVIVRIGIFVVATVLAAPLLTGSEEGALARAGVATLIALGLAATPVLACGMVGVLVVFNRRLRQGDFIELAGRTGRVRNVTLLEVAVEDESGCEVRIPHVLSLWNATRFMGPAPAINVELVIDPKAPQTKVRDVLSEAAAALGASLNVELVSIDADGALYRIAVLNAPHPPPAVATGVSRRTRSAPGGRTTLPGPIPAPRILSVTSVQLTAVLVDALTRAAISFGRRSGAGRA